MLIKMTKPGSDFTEKIDTGVVEVEITQAYIGPTFISDGGEELVVTMRDNGFEVFYRVDGKEQRINLNEGGFVAYAKRDVDISG